MQPNFSDVGKTDAPKEQGKPVSPENVKGMDKALKQFDTLFNNNEHSDGHESSEDLTAREGNYKSDQSFEKIDSQNEKRESSAEQSKVFGDSKLLNAMLDKAMDVFNAMFDDYKSDAKKVDESENREQIDKADEPRNPRTEDIDGKTHYYDKSGNLYRVDNELIPNNTYELNGYKYTTDDHGRIVSVEGKLHLKDREGRLIIRDSIEDIGKGDEQEDDDRGHLIGDQFDGSNGLENLIPQDADINRNDFRIFENELAKEVRDGKEVYVKIEPIYEGDSRRPVAIVVIYSINGKEEVRVFPNSQEGNK